MASGYGQKGSRMLSPEQQQQVFRHQAAIAELLRHFWSCFPARNAQLEAKVSRWVGTLNIKSWSVVSSGRHIRCSSV